ncbi:hypothetical protein [Oceanisphaera ostreae]|uniref:Oligosaccharide biosynthesis protein Alg14 n=1 Tax=Oceanisphaera ostreae TaxID=914151 RepID=A0ABW3KEP4_9GAMM
MKLLLVASFGGHWVQLKRISELLDGHEKTYVTTSNNLVQGSAHSIGDFSVREFYKGLIQFPKALKIIKKTQPDVVISTGAAPGVLLLFAAFILGKKTIWIDSIANSKRLSLSGRISCLFSSRVLTQWPELARGRVQYLGRLL